MKKALLAIAIASLTANLAIASENHTKKTDVLPVQDGMEVLTLQELQALNGTKRVAQNKLGGQSAEDKYMQRILVFYQPSYADKFGEDVIHQRIEKSILGDYQKTAGDKRVIEIVDIRPLTSVPNHLPYLDRIDLSGDVVSLGYNYDNRNEPNMYSILDVPTTEGRPENEWVKYYQPDLVTIYRDVRVEEATLLGRGYTPGVNTMILDSGTGLLTPDENNILSTTVPHEFGHNHGLNHEVSSEGESSVDADGEYTSNHAAQCGDGVTVMWSSAGGELEALDFYSSPLKFHKGDPCGYLADQDGALNGANNQAFFELYFDNVHSQSESAIPEPSSEISFVNESITVSESDGFFTLQIAREGDLSSASHVYVRSTGEGEADFPEDIMQYKVKAEFEAGQALAEVRFDVMQDVLEENAEVIEFEFVYPFGSSVASENVSVRIHDSYISPEERGVVTLLEPREHVNEGDVGYIQFSRTNGTKGDILISLLPEFHLFEDTGLELFESIVGHSFEATESRDYLMPSKYVVIRDGETSLSVPVQTINDLDPEPIEGVVMSLASLSGDDVIIESADKGALLISDDDHERAGVLAIEATQLAVKESEGKLDFTVYRDLDFEGGVPFEVNISIDHANGQREELTLRSSFEIRPDYSEDATAEEEEGTDESEEGIYEALKYFTHTLNPTSGEGSDYTVTVGVNNLVDNGLVDPEKSEVVFTIEDDGGAFISNYEGQNGGGSMNIVYLLVIGAVAWFRRSKNMFFSQ